MRLLIAALVSFVVSAIAGKILIPVLRRMKAGQSIKEDGPTWHTVSYTHLDVYKRQPSPRAGRS